jgi:hypothetical protein
MFGFDAFTYGERLPIEFTQHLTVGANPSTEDGYSTSEETAVWHFSHQLQEVLKGAEGKFLFIRRAPELRSKRTFERGDVVYAMIGRFSLGHLKGEKE